MTTLSELVEDAKLTVRFFPDYVSHEVFDPAVRGTREEKWRRDQFLGRGGFGTVWLERGLDDNDQVRAVKMVPRQSRSSHATIDFTRELEAMYARQFVNLFGWYEDIRSTYITMEYFPLGDLQSHLSSPMPESDVQVIIYQVLQGLEHLHNNEFAHRDLKPENIFVVQASPEWWIKIGDLGISKRVNQDTALRTRVGSPGYLAPEIVEQELYGSDATSVEYTHAVDVWALGVMTHYMLTKLLPFKQLHEFLAYARGGQFPMSALSEQGIGSEGQDFIRSLMTPAPKNRMDVGFALQNAWIKRHSQSSNTKPEQPPNGKHIVKASDSEAVTYDPVEAGRPRHSQKIAYAEQDSEPASDLSRSWFGTNEWTTREATARTLRGTMRSNGTLQRPNKPLPTETSMEAQPLHSTRKLSAPGAALLETKPVPSESAQEPPEDKTISQLDEGKTGSTGATPGEAQHLAGLRLWRIQKCDKAEAKFNEAYRIRTLLLGLYHEYTLYSLHMIVRCMLRQRKFSDARQLLQRHCVEEQKLLGHLGALTIAVCDHLARQLFEHKDYENAASMGFLLYRALDQKDTEQAKEEQLSRWNYAICLYRQRRYTEVKDLCQSIKKQSARRHEGFYFKVRFLMALCHFQYWHFIKDAQDMFRDLHHDQCNILGRSHHDTLMTLHMLGCVDHRQKNYNSAYMTFKEIYTARVKAFGERNAHTMFSASCHKLSSKAQLSTFRKREGSPPPIPIHEPTIAWWEQLPGPELDNSELGR
ncbi:kinase-like domain-containing protein [Aspergillus germanicus]